MYKGKPVPDEPKTTTQEQKQQPVVGTLISKVKQLEIKNTNKIEGFNLECRKEWKTRTESGVAGTRKKSQKKGENMLDPSWVGTRVEYLAYYDIDKAGKEKTTPGRWEDTGSE